MADTPWYKTYFGEDYLHRIEPVLTSERTQKEVDRSALTIDDFQLILLSQKVE